MTFVNFLEDMGEWPEGTFLDRIDPNGNYCKENCRWADPRTSAYNKRIYKNNKTGCPGVTFRKQTGYFIAQARENGKTVMIGQSYKTVEEAIMARRKWNEENL